MEITARQQVDAWQRDAQGTLWSGYGDDDPDVVDLDEFDPEEYPRRVVRTPRRHRG